MWVVTLNKAVAKNITCVYNNIMNKITQRTIIYMQAIIFLT